MKYGERLPILYINWDKPADAEASLQELTSSFSENPGIAQAVYDIAEWYREFNPRKAIEIFQYTLDTWPESDHAMWAQSGLVQSYLALRDEAGAQAAIEKLLTVYSEDENIADIVIYIANEYWPSSPQALELYEYAMRTWPDNKDAIRARAGLIRANIALGNDLNVPEAVDELLEQFSGSEFIAEAVCIIADSYHDAGKYENARRLYQLVADNWPGNDEAIWARASLISLNIALGNDTNMEAAIDGLIAEFTDNPALPEVLLEMGVGYYEMASGERIAGNFEKEKSSYEKAIDVWERIIREFSDDNNINPQAYYFSAKSYHRIGEHEKAINYYQKLLCDWPGYNRAGRAQFSIGKCYESLKDAGTLAGSEADLKIEKAYKAVLENYPDSASAKDACLKLGWLNFSKGLWPESVHYWELSREKLGVSPKDYKALNILYPLGRAYEELGRFDLAAKAYREFINMAPSIDPRVEKVKARLEQLALDKG